MRAADRIRIALHLEHALDRAGLAALLEREPDLAVVGEAPDTVGTVRLIRELRPDVLVLGRGRNCGGIGLEPILACADVGTRVIVVVDARKPTDDGESAGGTPHIAVALGRGARGIVRRDTAVEDLLRAIRVVHAGGTWYEPVFALMAMDGDRESVPGPLSTRHLQVAALVAEGHCNKEIGVVLGICEATVKKHVCQVLSRLGLRDRLQLGLYVSRHPDLFGPPSPELTDVLDTPG